MTTAGERAKARLAKLRKDKKFLEEQLSIASDIQNFLLPKRIPRVEGYEMAAFYQPCDYVGGDYYDFIEIDEQHLGILVADVAGKGIPGALVMSQVRTLMRCEALHSLSPREVLLRLNSFLYTEVPRGMFITMFYALLNIPRSIVTCASAGHNPPIYWNQGKMKYELVKPEGLALSVDSGHRFDALIEEMRLQLQPGDRLVMYTDGVTEAMDRKRQQFGESSLFQVFAQTLNQDGNRFLSSLIESINAHRGRAPQSDDITVVSIRRTHETPTSVSGFTYIEGERFIRCSGCGSVNLKIVGLCPRCRQATVRKPLNPKLNPAPGVTQCSSCKRIFRAEGWRDGCPYCSKRLCMVCGVRIAAYGMYCEVCAPKSLNG